MLVVKCVEANNSTVLVEGRIYYAFPINQSNSAAYISKFPDERSNFGCFQMSRFDIQNGSHEQLLLF